MVEVIVGLVIVAIFGWGIWLAMREARNRGRAEAERDASQDARKVEQEMTDAILKPTSPAETKDKLKKGQF